MAGLNRPQDKQIIDQATGRIKLEWDAYFSRLESLLTQASTSGVTSFAGRTGAVTTDSGDYTASEVTNVPAGNIAAVTVQTAIDELDSEKLAAASYTAADVLAKLLTVDGAGSGLNADLLDGLSSADFVAATSYTAADVLAKLLTVDGASSGLDADLLDGFSSGDFAFQLTIQTYSASATHTPTSGTKASLVIVTGAGGGGGGADCSSATDSTAIASSGSAAGTAIRLYNATEMGASAAVTIGAVGTAGANTGTDGGAGGDAVFNPAGTGDTLTGTGGLGGDGVVAGASTLALGEPVAGGVPTGGQINIKGGDSFFGTAHADYDRASGAPGGASFWGGGPRPGASVTSGQSAGNNGVAPGTGGSGAVCQTNTTGAAGGTGGPGLVVVIELS